MKQLLFCSHTGSFNFFLQLLINIIFPLSVVYRIMGWGLFVMSLISMQDKISKAIGENEYSIGIFFDLAKAFDTVNHAILLKKIFTGSVAFNSAG